MLTDTDDGGEEWIPFAQAVDKLAEECASEVGNQNLGLARQVLLHQIELCRFNLNAKIFVEEADKGPIRFDFTSGVNVGMLPATHDTHSLIQSRPSWVSHDKEGLPKLIKSKKLFSLSDGWMLDLLRSDLSRGNLVASKDTLFKERKRTFRTERHAVSMVRRFYLAKSHRTRRFVTALRFEKAQFEKFFHDKELLNTAIEQCIAPDPEILYSYSKKEWLLVKKSYRDLGWYQLQELVGDPLEHSAIAAIMKLIEKDFMRMEKKAPSDSTRYRFAKDLIKKLQPKNVP